MMGQYALRSLEAHRYQDQQEDSPALKNGPEITLRCIRSQLHWTTNLSKGTYDQRTSSPFHEPCANVCKESLIPSHFSWASRLGQQGECTY